MQKYQLFMVLIELIMFKKLNNYVNIKYVQYANSMIKK